MDDPAYLWHFPDMHVRQESIPVWHLYGETTGFPDVLHIERIADRAAGLDWRIAPHRHAYLHQVFLLQAGRIRLWLDDTEHAIEAPTLANVPPGTVHGFAFSAGTEGYVLTLPVAHFDPLFGAGAETAPAAARAEVVPAGPEDAATFAGLLAAHRSASPFRRTLLAALASAALCRLVARMQAPSDRLAPGSALVARFRAEIAAGLREGRGVAEHARALNISARHLSRLCRSVLGQSARGVIDAERLREACRLLVYTRMPVSQVGYATGWADPSYFGRSFRRAMGMTPGAYRATFEG